MNKIVNTILLFLASVSAGAQTLDAYLREAEANSPVLAASKAEADAALQRVPQFGLPDPTLKVSALGQMAETRVGQQMTRVSLEQMFPWFGTLAAQKNAAALNAQAAFDLHLEARNKLFYQVRSAYYPLFEVRSQIELQKANRDILATYKTLATSRFESGRGKLADVLRVDIMLHEIDTEIKLLETREHPLRIAFNRLLNREDDAQVTSDMGLSIITTPALAHDSILTNNPQLLALQQKRRRRWHRRRSL
ncbi:MAG: TolC family protein [Bacteroidia bacterium]|nr:TolC family protein [Bacteroidia bacterium]